MEKIIEGIITFDDGTTGKIAIINTDENTVALKQAISDYTRGSNYVKSDIDNTTKIIISDYSDSKGELFDKNKHLLNKPKYDVISQINSELQLVNYDDGVAIYNHVNNTIILHKKDIIIGDFIDGCALIKFLVDGSYFYNYIDIVGNLLLKGHVIHAENFRSGYAVILSSSENYGYDGDDVYTLIDTSGREIYSGFDTISLIINNFPIVRFLDERENYLDLSTGKLLLFSTVERCNQFVGNKAIIEDDGIAYEVNNNGEIKIL